MYSCNVDGAYKPGKVTIDCRETPPASTLGVISILFSVITILISLTAFVWVRLHRNHKSIKVGQPALLLTLCIGVAVIATAAATLPVTLSASICTFRLWAVSIGSNLVLSSVTLYAWRLHVIFSSNKVRVNASPQTTLKIIAASVFVDVILLVLLLAGAGEDLDLIRRYSDGDRDSLQHVGGAFVKHREQVVYEGDMVKVDYDTCSYTPSAIVILIVLLRLLNLIAATYYTFLVRKIGSRYIVAKNLIFSLYNVFIIVVVLVILDSLNDLQTYTRGIDILSILSTTAAPLTLLVVTLLPRVMAYIEATYPPPQARGRGPSSAPSPLMAFGTKGQDGSAVERGGGGGKGGSAGTDEDELVTLLFDPNEIKAMISRSVRIVLSLRCVIYFHF